MKKGFISRCVAVFVIMLATGIVFSEEVAKDEVSAVNGDTITFINYEGPHTTVDTYTQIGELGSALGVAAQNGTAGNPSRYYVIHAVDPATKEGFDADIFILGQNAGVDHIRNLRHIIASYLSSAYGYSARDGETLAGFITVYNAVYRGKMDFFTQRYKSEVTRHLSQDKVGLSTYWEDWAGKTQILIPLTGALFRGTISTVDTTAISDKNVVSSMQETEDKGIDTRKDMTDLKERESEAATNTAEQAQKEAARKDKAIKKEETAIASDKKKVEQDKKAIDQQKKETKALEKKADRTPEEDKQLAEKKKDIEQKEAAVAEKEADIAQREEAVTKEQESSEQLKNEASEASKLAENKDKEVQQDRETISADQKEIIAKETSVGSSGISGLRVIDERAMLCDIVMINSADGTEMKASTLKAIRGRTLIASGSGYIAVAGTKSEGAIRLVRIDSTTLDITEQGADNIAEQSMLIPANGFYFAVLDTPEGFRLGKFDNSLKLVASSQAAVSSCTMVTVSGSNLLVQDNSGSMILLNATDLKQK